MTTRYAWRRVLIAAAAIAGAAAISLPAHGDEPFIGEIRWVGSDFCPLGWAAADGQLLPISENEAVFALIGTTYGGDGETNFALPDLRSRTTVHAGAGPGLSSITQGEMSGTESRTITTVQLPTHDHTATTELALSSVLYGSTAAGTTSAPAGAALAVTKRQAPIYAAGTPDEAMADSSVVSTAVGGTATTTIEASNSGTAALSTRDPYLGLKACISLFGVFPSRD